MPLASKWRRRLGHCWHLGGSFVEVYEQIQMLAREVAEEEVGTRSKRLSLAYIVVSNSLIFIS